jgi:hypothetical protein
MTGLLLQGLVPLVLLRGSGVGPADEAVTRKPRTSGLTKPDLMGADFREVSITTRSDAMGWDRRRQ